MLLQVFDNDLFSARIILIFTEFYLTAANTRVQIVAGQNQYGDNPNPQHEDDERTDGAVKHVVAREVGNVNIEAFRSQDKK